MTLLELKKAFHEGSIDKASFIREANEFHSVLSHYPEVLVNSAVDEIKINVSGVAFHIAEDDLWIRYPPGESRVAPVEILNFGGYEPQETQLMLQLLRESQVIFDVGANIGWYTLLFARRFPGASIHAFEPLPYFSKFLVENVTANGFDNKVNTHSIGFSSEAGSVDIFLDKGNGTNASMRNVADAAGAISVPVEVVKMDDWCAEHALWPDFIKCDVEGAELLVVQGATKTLAERRPVVFLEILRKWSKAYDYHPNELIELLTGMGYECFGIGPDGAHRIQDVTEATPETNYVFLHLEAHSDLCEQMVGPSV
ncbi:FkbM family methyltransferase [Congregibacter litoralis]|uniref:Methyltransferase, FkbM family n=1 Tax=Congregibacter litoralis KT71 TaxID=314285 RepID=A4A6H2_9GAMM|nr:FkbM family methyltransferase [Congregibacter litoralis]EAQ98619.2 methyltransferase, FkbM family [Congregibacter litoralis KT71]